MDFATVLEQLNIQLGDTGDITFTPEEKTRALTKAWNDSYVVKEVWDTLAFVASTFSYPVPTSMDTVKDIYTRRGNSTGDAPETLSADLWEVIAGTIQFKNGSSWILTDGYTYYIKGNKKLTVTDTLDTVNLQEYVLATAGFNTLTLLGYKKANLFLKNDLTMAELIGLRGQLDTERKELRSKLARSWENA